MKLNQKLAGMLLCGSLVWAGCAENPADKVPAATVSETPAVTASSSPAPTAEPGGETPSPDATAAAVDGDVYAFAEGTVVGFVGSKVTGSHSGGFSKVTGTVTVPEGAIDKSVVELTIDMNSLYSDNEKLTGHLKDDDFFSVEKFKESTFKSKVIKKSDAGFDVRGDLTLRGVTKSVGFPATITMEGDSIKTEAKFAINRKDFGIEYAGKKDDLIRDEVVIHFEITANKKV